MNTSISRCKITDFNPIKKLGNDRYKLCWGMEKEFEKVYALNEETNEVEFTGEIKETDWCTYESGVYQGILTPYLLDKALENSNRQISIGEYIAIITSLKIENPINYLINKLSDIVIIYDSSKSVNEFYINDKPLWLDREERGTLERRFRVEQKNGLVNTTLWKNGIAYPMVIENAIVMLDALEIYAIQCHDNTQRHLAAIQTLQTIEEIEAYDYTAGYPEKLRF